MPRGVFVLLALTVCLFPSDGVAQDRSGQFGCAPPPGTSNPIILSRPDPVELPRGALPPGLYRAGAMPLPPPAFYDLSYYYSPGLVPYVHPYAYSDPGRLVAPYLSNRDLRERASIPYDAVRHDAQEYHYLNSVIRRDESLLRRNSMMVQAGLESFAAGQYERAAVSFLGGADANQGDAASRIFAGHALFALGRYDEAAKLIRRALELQPLLSTANYDIRDDYGRQGDFDRHNAALEQYVAAHPRDAAGHVVLGYVRYYSTGPGSAYDPLVRARRLDPHNELVEKLLNISGRVHTTVRPVGRATVPAAEVLLTRASAAGE